MDFASRILFWCLDYSNNKETIQNLFKFNTKMAFKSEHLEPVTNLSNELCLELNSSHKKVEKIAEILKKISLISNIDYENSSKQLIDVENKEKKVKEESNVEKIKKDNLQLILDIQREEFLNRKWKTVFEQNQEIFNSLTDWIKLNIENEVINRLEKEALTHLKIINQSKSKLQDDVKLSEQRIQNMVHIIQELQNIIEQEIGKTT